MTSIWLVFFVASASARLIPHHRYDLDLLPEELQRLFDELESDKDIGEMLKNPKYKVIHSS